MFPYFSSWSFHILFWGISPLGHRGQEEGSSVNINVLYVHLYWWDTYTLSSNGQKMENFYVIYQSGYKATNLEALRNITQKSDWDFILLLI